MYVLYAMLVQWLAISPSTWAIHGVQILGPVYREFRFMPKMEVVQVYIHKTRQSN